MHADSSINKTEKKNIQTIAYNNMGINYFEIKIMTLFKKKKRLHNTSTFIKRDLSAQYKAYLHHGPENVFTVGNIHKQL